MPERLASVATGSRPPPPDSFPGKRLPAGGGFAAPADERKIVSLATLMQRAGEYLGEDDLRRIREAYRFGDQAHLGQFRSSCEPATSGQALSGK